nr:hypothetical protein [Tanacetum cinerariifolium]
MRPPFRPAGHKPHGPSMNPRRPTMNGTRPYKTIFQTPSFETRPFLKSSAVNNSYRAPWVPTANSTKNHTADMGRKGKAVKPSACWTWNPSQELSNKGQFQNNIDDKGRNFKLLDDTNILLRTLRQYNMYSIDLNNIVPHKDLTCLVAKASAD